MSKFEDLCNHILKESVEFDIETFIKSISGELVKSAQVVYDDWEQDSEGYSEEYGGGGICDRVADEMSSKFEELNDNEDWESYTQFDEYECHTDFYVANHKLKEIVKVGLSPFYYEQGGGYNWTKLPDVTLTGDMILVDVGYDYENTFSDDGEYME